MTTIYLSTELAVRDHREVWNAVCEHLHATLGERHRQGLGPVVELERDEVETQAATGTDGVTGDLYLSDLRARDRRAGFAVVPTPHRPRH